MNCPFCLSESVHADEGTLNCRACGSRFQEHWALQVPEKLELHRNPSLRSDAYWPDTQAIHGRNGAVVLIGGHAYKPGCCDRAENEHVYVWREGK